MDEILKTLISQFPMIALIAFFYWSERQENKRLVESNRQDNIRHEETMTKIVSNISRCPAFRDESNS